MDSNFVRHSPCPACGSRDNLGIYSDGHKWCFGCGHYEPAIRTLENSRPKPQESIRDGENASPDYVPLVSTDIPEKPLKWLKKYGISDEEIAKHGILWVPEKQSLILGTQYRYFGDNPKHPKAVSFKKGDLLLLEKNDTVCFVEDFISAIKVGQWVSAVPLYGSHIDASALKWAIERFSRVCVWLDPDMKQKTAKAVLRGKLMGCRNMVGIYSDLDPKDYDDWNLRKYLFGGTELFADFVV